MSASASPDLQPLTVRSFGLTDPGRVRPNNEDVFLVGELARTLIVRHTNIPQPDETHSRHRGYVFLVADGVGGNEAGDVASQLGAASVEEFLLNTFRRVAAAPSGDGQAALQELQAALRRADARLFDAAGRHPEWRGMGTTLTLALAAGRRLFVAHAGDSRCYLYSGDALRQLTADHTVVADLARSGLLTRAEQAHHPWRHVVTNLLGGTEPGVRAEVHLLDLHAGDALLLCSDGLTDMVADEAIAAVLAAEADPEAACRRLVDEANRNGGKDNVTAVVARFDGPS
ncbi:PP2C family protein-serine/threonine phosphatase [Urbifossiella limnaea]|uniref:Serine/threonine phosphatase stp n=1 Tax=Urbifossiella limnaea TaxID=2528023 RepID=A0A517Y2A5_9BACT|nr:protein phosphatase 2C domain-containing protein [Urbifossiella limnaea]QDU23885.1 Serine/threonine phosphatase stp [Urbifossiella limnaea]